MRNDPHISPTAICCENVTQASRLLKSDVCNTVGTRAIFYAFMGKLTRPIVLKLE